MTLDQDRQSFEAFMREKFGRLLRKGDLDRDKKTGLYQAASVDLMFWGWRYRGEYQEKRV